MREGHLSPEQVLEILNIVQEQDAILIGGQCINLWAEYYSADPALAAWAPYTSKDIDFYRNPEAATRLKYALDGTLRVPASIDDATPNAATVVGSLGGKHIEIDFLARVLGVDDASISRNYVTIQGTEQATGRPVRILLMGPLDCFRSRLKSLNFLKRRDEIAVNQSRASIVILRCFIEDLLRDGARKKAQTTLFELAYLIKEEHIGNLSHLEHGLQPEDVLRHFLKHPELDERWRNGILAPAIERTVKRLVSYETRWAAKYGLHVEGSG